MGSVRSSLEGLERAQSGEDEQAMSVLQVHHDEEVGTVLVVQRHQRARTEYRCSQCWHPIVKGEVYRYEWQMLEGDSITLRFHEGCID